MVGFWGRSGSFLGASVAAQVAANDIHTSQVYPYLLISIYGQVCDVMLFITEVSLDTHRSSKNNVILQIP